MNETDTYEPLAEIILKSQKFPHENLYCLCSRTIIWDYTIKGQNEDEDVLEELHDEKPKVFNSEEENAAKFFNSSTESPPPIKVFRKRDHEEAVSCYCSASHYSTDEHDSLRESTLHHSDSGADLSESSRDLDWEKYWSVNGERLIWDSWISKYGDYIDPNYVHPNLTESEQFHNDDTSYVIKCDEEKTAGKRISFAGLLDEIDVRHDHKNINCVVHDNENDDNLNKTENTVSESVTDVSNDVVLSNILTRRSSDVSESGNSGSAKSDASSNGEEIRLSSGSRCSGNSFALTATTDSMTNVTRMTISSSDSVTDESSARSNSFLSTSNSQCDADQQWQQLWVEHFNEQYYAHYAEFSQIHCNKVKSANDNPINYFRDIYMNEGNVDYLKDGDYCNDKSDVESSDPVTCVLKGDNQMDSSSDCPDVGNLCLDESNTSNDMSNELEVKVPIKKMRRNRDTVPYYTSIGRTLEILKHQSTPLDTNKDKVLEATEKSEICKKHNVNKRDNISRIVSPNMDVDSLPGDRDSSLLKSDLEEFRDCDCKMSEATACESESVKENATHSICNESESKSDGLNEVNINNAVHSKDVTQAFGNVSTTTPEGSYCECVCEPMASDVEFNDSENQKTDSDNSKTGISVTKRNGGVNSQDRVKSAFSLMGFSYEPGETTTESNVQNKYLPTIKYKKKNIRFQNRFLKLNFAAKRSVNKHVYFNDDNTGECSALDKVKMFLNNKDTDNPINNDIEIKNEEVETDITPKPSVYLDSVSSEDVTLSCKRSSSKMEVEDFSEKDDSTDEEEDVFFSAESVKSELDVKESGKLKPPQRKKKRKQFKKKPLSYSDVKEYLPPEILSNRGLLKYWCNRYRLFSKYDDGIKLDSESWYSVTPEKVSKHIAERCRCDLVIDAFCGAGGNAIQFAFTCERVIAIDIDPAKIELAKHNATVYGVEDRIEFIIGDFFKLAPTLCADVIFLSPPWGGPEYTSMSSYSLDSILPPIGGKKLYDIAAGITDNVVYFLPRNTNTDELIRMGGPGTEIEIEQNFLNKRLISVTAYSGELINYI